ncbi:NAD(P)/FAD-dependent oxidoreductase [Polynucleobacter sp. CS-Odin-A6]|uniref:NAD(P)/FAD-dependent oxidoreductase n=1 Tax=Polynucleobacter sp. CS-Odin-A6 TaxID=2689106 RepID=UPI001C0ACC48|nr:FAD-dependent oxidoreductase [Polynucleobacter sp. CS-Odin-A6]MBU3620630.1 FAD-dependent oxidoreductase [Polynucleobacter sp. CS-Odin-A6]
MNSSTQIKKVAVVGAGIAGLSCAVELQSFGLSVDIYEKSRGPSGRMSTRQMPEWSADHGAQYFTARDPRFIEAVEEWIKNGVADIWRPRIRVFEDMVWRESHSQEIRYVGTPNMNSPGKFLAEGLSIQYDKTISQIDRRKDQWVLQCTENGEIETAYDFVVLALPAPQGSALARDIDPRISSVIDTAQMKGCWTMMAHFPHQVPPEYDAAFINGESISWICQNTSKPMRQGRPIWTIHGSPTWSQANIELSKEEAQSQMLDCLEKLGFDYRDAEISMHRWRYASGALEHPIHFLWLGDISLGLCGDWLNGGRVEGGWLSGFQLAEAIIESQESAPSRT